jgi:outer membrane biosynthesis protein TonB
MVMPRSTRTPVLVSLAAHGAFFALCHRLREPEYRAALVDGVAIELELLTPFVVSRARERPVEPVPEPVVAPRPIARAARVIAAPAAVEGPATTSPSIAPELNPQRSSEPPSRAAVTGLNLLRSIGRDAYASERWRFGSAPVEGPVSPEQLAEQRALSRNVGSITDRWRDDVYRSAPPPRPAGSSEYVRRVTSAAARLWAPVRAEDPGLLDGVTRLLTAGLEGYRAAQADHLGMFANGRAAAAADSLERARPNSPTLQSNPTLNEAGRAMTQRIAVEIDVRQSPDGALLSLRVARTSGTRFFDRQAEEAVRRAIAQAGQRARADGSPPGATRSRWEFELRIGRNPPAALGPQLPGSPVTPNYISGGVEWGGVDPPRPMYPFALHRYQRVRVLWITSDASSAAASGGAADAGAR